MVMLAGVGAVAAAMREGTRGMKETATIGVAEVTAAAAGITAIVTAVAARGMIVRTRLAEVRGTKSPRTALHHHPPVGVEVAEAAGGQGLTPPMAEKDEASMPLHTLDLNALLKGSARRKFRREST